MLDVSGEKVSIADAPEKKGLLVLFRSIHVQRFISS